MFLCLLFLVFIVTSPALSSVVRQEHDDICTPDEFKCGVGECVSWDKVCDGNNDCFYGLDELLCLGVSNPLSPEGLSDKSKRQATSCRENQWQCRDGTCIGFDGICDGTLDCPDRSDETHALCRKMQCQSNWFRCTYGACVDGTAPCNGVQECYDNSDELLPRCRNETYEASGKFKCSDGQMIAATRQCDGVVDCLDGSDEIVRACVGNTCPSYLFQCEYGACVDQGSDCNGVQECADGSDESDELCGRISSSTIKPRASIPPPSQTIPQGGKCVLPPYPDHGTYTVAGNPNAKPKQAFTTFFLNITCDTGFDVENNTNSVQCYNGQWSNVMPKCVRFCQLNPHASVEYRCIVTGDVQGFRICRPKEPSGTTVEPVCRAPNYYYSDVLKHMKCIDGNWNYIATCKPGTNSGKTNITINISDRIKIHITTNSYNPPNIEIDTGNKNNIKVQSSDIINLKVPAQNGKIDIVSVYNNDNNQNILTRNYGSPQNNPTSSYGNTQNGFTGSNGNWQNLNANSNTKNPSKKIGE